MTRKKTIALLLSASLALHGVLGMLQEVPFIIPDEEQLELLQENKDNKGNKKRVLK